MKSTFSFSLSLSLIETVFQQLYMKLKLTLNGSHVVDPDKYVDVRLPTIERHPIELERRPEVRSCGTGSILIFDWFSLCLRVFIYCSLYGVELSCCCTACIVAAVVVR